MSMSDPIADMLTRIRNAGKAKFNSVEIPGSKLKLEVAKILKEQGFIANFKFTENDKQGILTVYIRYADQESAIFEIQRVSKPSRRRYIKAKDITPVLNGLGINILSTSKGIMTDKTAKQQNIGGEILCKVS